MKTHLDQLLGHIPTLLKGRILDVGSGNGKFLVDVAKRGGEAFGLEKNKEYIDSSLVLAKKGGVTISVKNSVAEKMPFEDNSFDFINVAEIIEHVENPDDVFSEVYRILKIGGLVYVSVPSRYSIEDPHFRIYFVNWLPRKWSDGFISIFGKHKDYSGTAGRQRLADMHYFTYRAATSFFKGHEFNVEDIRENKIRYLKVPKVFIYCVLVVYRCVRPFLFTTFHFLLRKTKNE